MKTAMATLCAIGIALALYGLTDAIDRHGDTQAELAQAFRDGCLPTAGETAIIVSDGRVARCRIIGTASTSLGLAPKLISAAVVGVAP